MEAIIRLFGGSRTGWKLRFARLGLPSRPEGVRTSRKEEQIAEVLRLRGEGVGFGEIGRRLNISRQRAHQIYARENAETTPDAVRRARREEILRQYRAGVPVKQIVRDCGLKNEQALRALAYRWGVSRR